MEFLFDEVIHETMEHSHSGEDIQRLNSFMVASLFFIGKLILKSDMLDREGKKQLFHKTVEHIKVISQTDPDKIANGEIKDLRNEYLHQLKKLRGRLRSSLEREVIEGLSHTSRSNLAEILAK